MAKKAVVTGSQIARRLQAFAARPAPALSRQTLEVEQELLSIWRENSYTDRGIFTPPQIEAICQSLAAKQNSTPEPQADFAERVFEALPNPTLIFQDGKSTWNRSFAERLQRDETWQRGFPIAEQVSVVRQLHSIVEKARDLGVNVIFVSLAGAVMRMQIVSLPEARLDIAYLHTVGESIQGIAPITNAVLLFQLSGLSHKQIAAVMDIPITTIQAVSKKNRQTLQALRALLISPETGLLCREQPR